jgi:hypothetical protein
MAEKENLFCVMGYTRGGGIFVRMSAENKFTRQTLKMTPMNNDRQ